MLAEFITKLLMMVLGYAYPAFVCFKTVEKNKVKIEELRFWCQYWVPMYAEMKLALFLYLWYPKTKGTGFVYETLLRPFVLKHETDIDNNLQELRSRMWDLAIYYSQNCTELGQTKFFQVIESLASKYRKIDRASPEKDERHKSKASLSPRLTTIFSFNRGSRRGKSRSI